MTTIFILGDKDDAEIGGLIKTRLSKSYRINYVGLNEAGVYGGGYELLAVEARSLRTAEVGSAIVLLKRDAAIRALPFGENAAIVAFSENEKQIRYLKKSRARIITCGFQKTDTISYSSLSDEQVMVSLNREITALSGKRILPLEIPLERREEDVYSLLAFTALRLLLDDFNSELGGLF